MAANEFIELTFTNHDPNDHGVIFARLVSVTNIVSRSIQEIAAEIGNIPAVDQPPETTLILDASPSVGSLKLRFRVDIAGEIFVRDPKSPTTRAGQFLTVDRGLNFAAVVIALFLSDWGTLSKNFEMLGKPAVSEQEKAIDTLASSLQGHTLPRAQELAVAAQQTGCASVTIQFADYPPIELAQGARTSAALISKRAGGARLEFPHEISGALIAPFPVKFQGREALAYVGQVKGPHGMVRATIIWLSSNPPPRDSERMNVQGEVVNDWKTSVVPMDGVPFEHEETAGVIVVRQSAHPYR
ncbi:hypothetical protein [Caulobacter sp. Root487D2Y]|uniref:hypothetical protein n=1 Tax=Caulobacter sp. Root487D2Y TaxID=1736547 RepID=UPI000AE6D049|nr:hypothetical protein [Caulobacter sp. Root487D2Y]